MNSRQERVPEPTGTSDEGSVMGWNGRRFGRGEANPDIHWPAGFTPDRADLFVHNEMTINARRERVFRHLVEAPQWPNWCPNMQNVRISTPPVDRLQWGSRFEFDFFGLHIDGTVGEFVPNSRVGWFATGADFDAYQTWLFLGAPRGGTRAVREEVARGSVAIALREGDPNRVFNGHEIGLGALKQLAQL
ncbi:SRPBCC family protein [Saccharopolyspora sp. 5N708]|uniref:SRPBCC family protein n=1 Tax=Saccharopolyspora sp. 5N708 TaxID=3457424 RepID=UPI003FD27526